MDEWITIQQNALQTWEQTGIQLNILSFSVCALSDIMKQAVTMLADEIDEKIYAHDSQ